MQPLAPHDPTRLGPYELVGWLDAGPAGHSYLARTTGGVLVEATLIRPELAGSEQGGSTQAARLLAEDLDAVRAVDARYAAAVLDRDLSASPPWFATSYTPGTMLPAAGVLPESDLYRLTAGLAHALAAVHAAGLVHGTLRPAAVRLTVDGLRVLGVGLTRALEAAGIDSGAAGYLSPEQASGGPVTPASDVHALGAVLLYAATGRPPFGTGPPPALLYRVVHQPPDLAGVPGPLVALVAACLAKPPPARPTVGQLLPAPPTPAAPPPGLPPAPPGPAAPGASRRKLLIGGAVLGGLLLIGAGVAGAVVLASSSGTSGRKPLWQQRIQGNGYDNALLANRDTVLFTADKATTVEALDAATGTTRWTWHDTPPDDIGGIALDDQTGTVYVAAGASGDKIHALAADTGALTWSVRHLPEDAALTITAAAGHLISAGTTVNSLDPATGTLRWSWPPPADGSIDSLAVGPTTVAVLFQASTSNTPWLYGIDPATGTRRWQFMPNDKGSDTGRPSAAADMIYIGSSATGGHFYALDATTGAVRWSSPVGQNVTSTAVIDDTTVYLVGHDTNAYALDARTGRQRWVHKHQGLNNVFGPVNGTLYATDSDGTLHALDTRTGHEHWHFTGAAVGAAAATDSAVVTVSDTDKTQTLYGLPTT